MPKKVEKVFVLRISHKHGTEVYVNKTEEGSLKMLHEYVQDWWEEGVGSRCKMPKNREKAIKKYFEVMDSAFDLEYYELTETDLGA